MLGGGTALCVALALAGAAGDARIAVLALDGYVADDAVVAMREQSDALSADVTRERLSQLAWPSGHTLESIEQRLTEADTAFGALETDRSLAILDGIAQDLSVDTDFSAQKQALLETARLKLVARVLGTSAGQNKAKAAQQNQRALAALVDALRVRPDLTLGPSYPPRAQALWQQAKDIVDREPKGVLAVDGRPAGATVMVEGRPVGTIPLRLAETLPRQRQRVWLEHEGRRSRPLLVDVGAEARPLYIDLAFEGCLWPAGAGLSPLANTRIDDAFGAKLAAFLDVDDVIIVAVVTDDSGRYLAAVRYGATAKTPARRVVLPWRPDTAAALIAARAAGVLLHGASDADARAAPLPAALAPPVDARVGSAAVAADEEAGVPWVAVGVGAGAVVAAVAATVITVVLLNSGTDTPSDSGPTMRVSLQSETVAP